MSRVRLISKKFQTYQERNQQKTIENNDDRKEGKYSNVSPVINLHVLNSMHLAIGISHPIYLIFPFI